MTEKYYNYNDLKQMQEKAKKFDYESDKKSFLKSLNPLEQKMVLLSSKRPYDVFSYLDSLNNKETNIMLNELTNEEISKLIEQFTSEDKKAFYGSFSNTVLVNRFIANDKNSFTHVDELDLERKIELLDSSKTETQIATKEIYSSLSSKEKQDIETKITSAEGSLIVENIVENNEVNLENNSKEGLQSHEEQQEEQPEEQPEEKQEEQPEEKQEEQQLENEKIEEINEFLKSRLEQYKEQNPIFKNFDISVSNIFENLSDELKEIVINDFNLSKKEQEIKLEEQEDLLNKFQDSKADCEIEIINNIKQVKLEKKEEVVNKPTESVKTL